MSYLFSVTLHGLSQYTTTDLNLLTFIVTFLGLHIICDLCLDHYNLTCVFILIVALCILILYSTWVDTIDPKLIGKYLAKVSCTKENCKRTSDLRCTKYEVTSSLNSVSHLFSLYTWVLTDR